MSPESVVNALRVALVLFGAYLTAVVLASVIARLIGAHVLASAIDRVTPALVRRLVASLMGVSLSLPTIAAAQDASADAPVVMHRVDDQPGLSVDDVPIGQQPPTVAPAPPPSPPSADETTWTIRPGEHFWAVAEAVLTRAWGRPPTDSETVPYWRELVEVNRVRLVVRDNPDLVYAGQEFVLPPVPSRS
jgi:hypothetical protein